MRCPKCHYISFGSGDRCRNCGYEFSLAAETKPLDLPIQNPDQPVGPMGDLPLTERAPVSATAPPRLGGEDPTAARRPSTASRLDLPLFEKSEAVDDAPLVSPSAVPRPPLSVRRGPPVVARPRPEKIAPSGEVEAQPARLSHVNGELRHVRAAISVAPEAAVKRPAEPKVAPRIARLLAGIIDVLILGAIDGAVVYFTLRLLNLPFADLRLLPPVPLGVFLLLLNGGYLATFTAAGGQTIGKMMTGIRVVAQPPAEDSGFFQYSRRVTFGAAVLRAAAYLVSLLPAGLGFVPILFGADGRALHDRLADTRVVKA